MIEPVDVILIILISIIVCNIHHNLTKTKLYQLEIELGKRIMNDNNSLIKTLKNADETLEKIKNELKKIK